MPRLLPVLLFLGVCSSFCTKPARSPVVLKAGTKTWTAHELEASLRLALKNLDKFEKKTPAQLNKFKRDHVQNLIFQILLENWAKKQKVKLPPTRQSSKIKTFFYGSSVSPHHLHQQKNKQALYNFLMASFFKQIPNPPIKKQKVFYKKNQNLFNQPAGCFLNQILVSSQGLAERLSRQIKGGAPFYRLAKLYSPQKISLGWVTQKSYPSFYQACQHALNTITPVLKSPYGYHILKVKKKRKRNRIPFQKVQQKIINRLKEEDVKKAFQKWLLEEMGKTSIFIDQSLLNKIHIQYKK